MASAGGNPDLSMLQHVALSLATQRLIIHLIEIANLRLTPEEQRLFSQVFTAANPDGIEVVTGDVALRFFPERSKLPSETLGEVRDCIIVVPGSNL